LLELQYPLLEYVDIYVPQPGGGYAHIETGDQRPFAARLLRHRNFVEPVKLTPGLSRVLYLHVDTQSTLNLAARLWSPHAFIEKTQDEQYLLGFYYGIILVMILY